MNMNKNDLLQFICANAEEYIPIYVKDESVQLIYLDTPFFKQNILKMYSKDAEMTYSFLDKWKSLNVYLEFIEDILVKCKSKLLNNGLIFLHCDSSASHHLRLLLDKVFGEKYFVNEIIWSYKRWSNSASHLLESHQSIFVYSQWGLIPRPLGRLNLATPTKNGSRLHS